MTEYGFYTTDGIPLIRTEKHRLAADVVSTVDKYALWITFISGLRDGEVRTYVGARFDYVKYWSSRYSRGILLVDIPRIEKMSREFLSAIDALAEEERVNLSTEMEKYSGDRSDVEELRDDILLIIRTVERYMRNMERSRNIGMVGLKLKRFNGVEYPPISYRWAFLGAVEQVLGEHADKARGGIKSLNDILGNMEILYPLVNYSRFHNRAIPALWFSNDAPPLEG
ncbi:hypothetical protein [Thermococcus sp.]